MKCDLHVHSTASGSCNIPLFHRFCRESYSDPLEVYHTLKQRGMNLVTLTDHDAIGGADPLRRHPDFFVSEELTCHLPSGTRVHIGVYDISEHQHLQIQRRRDDIVALLMYMTERQLFFTLNHVFSALTGQRDIEDFQWFEEYFPALEILNGALLRRNNREAARLARNLRKIPVAGSDAHVIASAGKTYTEVPGARNKYEFFAGLRAGRGVIHGESGSYWKLTRDLLLVGCEMMREKSWTACFAPLAAFVPLAAFANYIAETIFVSRWSRALLRRQSAQASNGGPASWTSGEAWA